MTCGGRDKGAYSHQFWQLALWCHTCSVHWLEQDQNLRQWLILKMNAFKQYSGTPLQQIPLGGNILSLIARCPNSGASSTVPVGVLLHNWAVEAQSGHVFTAFPCCMLAGKAN